MNSDHPENDNSNFVTSEPDETPIPKSNRLKKLSRRIDSTEQEDHQAPPEPQSSQEEEIIEYEEEPESKPRKKKRNLDKLAAKRKKEIEKEKEEQEPEEEFESKREDLMSSGQLEIQLNRKNRGKQPKVEELNKKIDELTNRKERKSKKDRVMVSSTMSTLQQLDDEFYTKEEDDENSREREIRYEEAMKILDKSERIRDIGRKKKGATSVKTRNKLFGEFNQTDFLTNENENEVYEQEYVGEDIERVKNEKKKDGTHIFNKVEKFKTEKVRMAPQKTQAPLLEKQPSILERQPSMKDSSNSNPKPEIAPSLTQHESVPSSTQEGIELGLSRAKSIDFKAILSQSKNSMSIDQLDRLLEIEVSVPHLARQPSQSLTENTLFLGHLTKTQTIVDKTSIKAASGHGNRQYKSLTAYADDLRKKIRANKSKNLTLDLIKSRFQATDLESLDPKLKKKSNPEAKGDDEDSANDSDFIPEDAKEDIVSDPNAEPIPVPSNFRESENPTTNVASERPKTSKGKFIIKKKSIGLEDIKRLEGEEDEEEPDMFGEDSDEQDEEAKETGGVDVEASDTEEGLIGTQNDNLTQENQLKNNERSNSKKISDSGRDQYMDQFQEMSIDFKEREEMLERTENKHRRIKRIGDKILETLKRREQEEAERKLQKELKKREREKMKAKMAGYMEVEAEVGSDNEENDDIAKQIDKRDQDENEDGLDADLAELFDFGYNDDGSDDPEALRKYLEDLKADDREHLKRVMQRNFANKRRKRAEFEYNLGDEEERQRRKALRMEEAIKIIEENDKARFENGSGDKKIQEEEDDIFNDEVAVKKHQLEKASSQVRKTMELKRIPAKEKDMKLFQTDEIELDLLVKSQLEKKTSQKATDQKTNLSASLNAPITEIKKASSTLMRSNTTSKNSVLDVKKNSNNISLFNNQFNKDVLNEYGNKSGPLSVMMNEASNSMNKSKTNDVSHASSSLNKLFTPNSELKSKTLSTPNKIPFFKQRVKKDN